MFMSQPIPADDAMEAIAPPSTMFGITPLGEVAQPTEIHQHHVEVGEGVRQARAVEQRIHDLADLGDRGVDLVGLPQVGLGEAGEAGEVGLLDVDRVHLGAELHEQCGRGCPHARCRAAHDHALAVVSEHVLHRSASRACPRADAARLAIRS